MFTHPLRGSIFENLAVIEPLKQRFNTGKRPNLFFYRENSGREADIVRDNGGTLDLFEVKSAKTFNRSFEKNLTYIRELLGDKVRDTAVVYDGEYIPPSIINIRQLTDKY